MTVAGEVNKIVANFFGYFQMTIIIWFGCKVVASWLASKEL